MLVLRAALLVLAYTTRTIRAPLLERYYSHLLVGAVLLVLGAPLLVL